MLGVSTTLVGGSLERPGSFFYSY